MQFKRLLKRFHEASKIIMVSDFAVKMKTLKDFWTSSVAMLQSYWKNLHRRSVITLNLVLVSFRFLLVSLYSSNSSRAILISIHVNWNLFYCFLAKSANLLHQKLIADAFRSESHKTWITLHWMPRSFTAHTPKGLKLNSRKSLLCQHWIVNKFLIYLAC